MDEATEFHILMFLICKVKTNLRVMNIMKEYMQYTWL